MPLDLAPVLSEARPIVERAAEVYLAHTQQWLVGLLLQGSALKGGVIPGCSDIDFQLYLEAEAFSEAGTLPLDLCLAIQRDLAPIDPAPFGYIQCYAYPGKLPDDQVGPVPGAYHLLAGSLPVEEATADQVVESARNRLSQLVPEPAYISKNMLEHGAGKLARTVRYLCTDVWPTLYHVLTLQQEQEEPLAVWRLPRQEAIALAPLDTPLSLAIHRFDDALRLYYPAQTNADAALEAIAAGVAFLTAAKQWWGETYGGWRFD